VYPRNGEQQGRVRAGGRLGEEGNVVKRKKWRGENYTAIWVPQETRGLKVTVELGTGGKAKDSLTHKRRVGPKEKLKGGPRVRTILKGGKEEGSPVQKLGGGGVW